MPRLEARINSRNLIKFSQSAARSRLLKRRLWQPVPNLLQVPSQLGVVLKIGHVQSIHSKKTSWNHYLRRSTRRRSSGYLSPETRKTWTRLTIPNIAHITGGWVIQPNLVGPSRTSSKSSLI